MRIFKEINWTLQEIVRYQRKYEIQISESYLTKIINEDLLFNRGDVIQTMVIFNFIKIKDEKIQLTALGEKIIGLAEDKYELTSLQKELIAPLYMNKHQKYTKDWFELFNSDSKSIKRN